MYLIVIDCMKSAIHPMFSVGLDTLVQDTHNETANHRSNQSSQSADSPKIEKDNLIESSVKIHHHHHISHTMT